MTTTFAAWAEADRREARTVRSADGVLVVVMQRTSGGMFVERVVQRPRTARIVQAMTFSTASSFQRWCEADVARFDHPLLYSKLAHEADELFASHAQAPG